MAPALGGYQVEERALGFDVNFSGTKLFTVQMVALFFAWTFVVLRAYVRLVLIKKCGLDDYLMFAAMILYTAYAVVAEWGIVSGGSGQHSDTLAPEEASRALMAWYICEVLYAPLSSLVRTSIAVFLLRIAVVPLHRHIIRGTIVVIWLFCIPYAVVMTAQCSPPSYFWESVLGASGHCIDPAVVPNFTIAHSAVSAASDFLLSFLPVAMLWNVQMNTRTKVLVGILLGMGRLAGIVLLIRIRYIKVLAISSDFLYETTDVAIWSVIEPSLGIFAGCLACLRPLVRAWGFFDFGRSQMRSRSRSRSKSQLQLRPQQSSSWPQQSRRYSPKTRGGVQQQQQQQISEDRYDSCEMMVGNGMTIRSGRGEDIRSSTSFELEVMPRNNNNRSSKEEEAEEEEEFSVLPSKPLPVVKATSDT